MLSMFKSEDFKNIVICFDDFERLSDKVSLKDVMGLISQLKEQKECKIIMILNEGELSKLSSVDGKPHDKIFSLYKEKIVDYSFHYQPDQEELFKAIEDDINNITFCNHQTIYDFFKKIDLKNIRIMKQALYLLEKFSFIKSSKYHKKVIDEFVAIALNLFVFKAKTNYLYDDFRSMRGYITAEEIGEHLIGLSEPTKEEGESAGDENAKFYDDSLPYRHTNEQMEKLIYVFLDKSYIDQKSLCALLKINTTLVDKDNTQEKIFNLVEKLLFELSEDINPLIIELHKILSQNKTLIPHIIRIEDLHKYFTYIKELRPNLIRKEFIDDYILSYYNTKGYVGKSRDFSMIRYNSFIERYYPHLQDEVDKKIEADRASKIDMATIIELLDRTTMGYTDEDANILNAISTSDYTHYIEISGEFFYSSIMFLKKRGGSTNDFTAAVENIKNALIELTKKGNSYNWRISQFLKQNNINIEEEK
jgi:hypothetical protein